MSQHDEQAMLADDSAPSGEPANTVRPNSRKLYKCVIRRGDAKGEVSLSIHAETDALAISASRVIYRALAFGGTLDMHESGRRVCRFPAGDTRSGSAPQSDQP